MANPKKTRLVRDLVRSIENEANPFDMSTFVTEELEAQLRERDSPMPRVTCGTASCIAGHLCAVRPGLARRFAAAEGRWWAFDTVAAAIWRHETGEAFCPLDFYAANYVDHRGLDEVPRTDAVDHVRGVSRDWPQFQSLDAAPGYARPQR